MRFCRDCTLHLTDENHYKNHSECKSCTSIRRKATYVLSRTSILSRVKKRSKKKRKQLNAYDRDYAKQNPDKRSAIYARRRAAKLNRVPNWLTKSDWIEIRWAYTLARQISKETGIAHEVDHIIPLLGKNISGLHCPQNLQIITAKENAKKKNLFPYIKGN